MRNRIFFYVFILLFLKVSGQTGNKLSDVVHGGFDVTNSSLAQFEKVFNTDVNEAFGIANIQIPLLSIKEGDINIPIYLTYNSKGVKVDQIESNVGLGWSISNIFISREIKDANDHDDGYAPNRVGYFTHKEKNVTYNLNNITSKQLLNVDMIPDLYNVYLPNSKGSFYFEDRQKYKLLSREELVIKPKLDSLIFIPNANIRVKDFYSINIKDEKGLIYDFSDYSLANFNSYEYKATSSPPGLISENLPLISNWHISKITDGKNNKEISFEYMEGKSFSTSNTYSIREIASGYYSRFINRIPQPPIIVTGYYFNKLFPGWEEPGLVTKGFLSFDYPSAYPRTTVPVYDYRMISNTKKYLKNLHIKKINFSEGYVLFDYDMELSKYNESIIKSIELYDFNNKLLKKFNFNYLYFNCYNPWDAYLNSQCKPRLKLSSIEEVGKGFYNFSYDQDKPLINIESKSFDYNGYYNGTYDSTSYTDMASNVYYYPNKEIWSLLPFKINPTKGLINRHDIHYNGNSNYEISRLPNFEYTKAGILTGIEYPTKGKQKFEYELNDFIIDNNAQDYQIGGGLRVKSITMYDDNNRLQEETSYQYINEDNTSSGEMIIPPYTGYPLTKIFNAYYDPTIEQIITDYNGLPNFYNDKLDMLFKIYDMPSESPIRYKRVVKSIAGKGKIITKFIDKENAGYYYPMHTPIPALSSPHLDHRNNFSEFLNVNSSFKQRYAPFNSLDVFKNITRKEIYDESHFKVLEELYDYETVKPQFDVFSGNNYYIKPILAFCYCNTTTAWEQPVGYADYVMSQGSVRTGYTYRLLLNNKVTKIFKYKKSGLDQVINNQYRYSLNRHAKPLTLFYEKNDEGYINGAEYIFLENNSNNIINNLNIRNKIIGTRTFNGYNILDSYDLPISINKTIRADYVQNASTSSLFLPEKIIQSISQNPVTYSSTYDRYDNKANLLQMTESGMPTTYIYGYRQLYPIAKIDGASYQDVMSVFGLNASDNQSYLQLDIVAKSNLDKDPNSEKILILALDSFRSKSGMGKYKITTYTYDPLIGVTSVTPPTGAREIYVYGTDNKLKEVRDLDGKILTEYTYKYK